MEVKYFDLISAEDFQFSQSPVSLPNFIQIWDGQFHFSSKSVSLQLDWCLHNFLRVYICICHKVIDYVLLSGGGDYFSIFNHCLLDLIAAYFFANFRTNHLLSNLLRAVVKKTIAFLTVIHWFVFYSQSSSIAVSAVSDGNSTKFNIFEPKDTLARYICIWFFYY
jgi:hypothetical protein